MSEVPLYFGCFWMWKGIQNYFAIPMQSSNSERFLPRADLKTAWCHYRGTSLIRNGSDKKEVFLWVFFFLILRMCNRPFSVNLCKFKNVPPTVFRKRS